MTYPTRDDIYEANMAILAEQEVAIARAKEIMPLGRWQEYFKRLEGPEGCDFKWEGPGETNASWKCAGGNDKSYSEAILTAMGLDERTINEALECVHSLGGHCDCEVLFNAAEGIDP